MVKFGASLLSWVLPVWTAEAGSYAIEKTAVNGFDVLEILLPASREINTKTTRKQLNDYHIEALCSFNLTADCHLPLYPEKAYDTIKWALDRAAELESTILGGVLHSGIGAFSGSVKTAAEIETVCEVLSALADYAAKLGITICPEPVNRYESYICNSSADLLELAAKIDKPNIALHLDTFHMNIEEDNFRDPIINAGPLLKHLHITESNRGMPGEGNVHWDEFFASLAEINYSGSLVLENFSSSITGMAEKVNLWRPSKYNADDLATGSLAFMKKKAIEFNLK